MKTRVFFNEDFAHFYMTRGKGGIDEGKITTFIERYRGSCVTDFLINVNGAVSCFPSKVLESMPEKHLRKEENGVPVDYSHGVPAYAYDTFFTKGLDPYAIWIDKLRQFGIRPWISLRMNDCHFSSSKAHWLKDSRMALRQDLWRTPHRKPAGYFDRCYNYAKDEVRQRMFAYVREVLDRYDPDGIEMDFMRESRLFVPGLEDRGVFSALVREIKSLADGAAKRRGHDIRLGIIVGESPQICFDAGMDIGALSREGLFDYVCPIARWDSISLNTPVEFWQGLLGGTPLAVGQQLMFRAYADSRQVISGVDMAFGQASSNLSRGADCVYLYNCFDGYESEELSRAGYPGDVRCPEGQAKILAKMGDVALMKGEVRRYPLTFTDFPPYWERINHRLPLRFPQDGFESIRIPTGDLKGDDVCLQLGVEAEDGLAADDFEIYLNGVRAEPTDAVPEKAVFPGAWHAFGAESFDNPAGHVVAEVRIKSKCEVRYAEIFASPRPGIG